MEKKNEKMRKNKVENPIGGEEQGVEEGTQTLH